MSPGLRRQLFCDMGRQEPLAFDKRWTEIDELEWLDRYAKARPADALWYCELILGGMRRWDATVNVDRLLRHVALLRLRLRDAKQDALRPNKPVLAIAS